MRITPNPFGIPIKDFATFFPFSAGLTSRAELHEFALSSMPSIAFPYVLATYLSSSGSTSPPALYHLRLVTKVCTVLHASKKLSKDEFCL